jgi:hypothetical protein
VASCNGLRGWLHGSLSRDRDLISVNGDQTLSDLITRLCPDSLRRGVCSATRSVSPAANRQAAIGDCVSFDPFAFDENGLASSEVDICRRQVANGLMISQVIVICDEALDLGFEPGLAK